MISDFIAVYLQALSFVYLHKFPNFVHLHIDAKLISYCVPVLKMTAFVLLKNILPDGDKFSLKSLKKLLKFLPKNLLRGYDVFTT